MLQIVPTSWCSWDFKISDESRPVADIAINGWRDKGALAVDGATYRVYREALLSGDFILEGVGGVLARAEKPGVFHRMLVIRHAGRDYTLRPTSLFRQKFVLLDGAKEVGSVAPRNAFTRKAAVDLPHRLPAPLRLFIVWLTMIAWRRDGNW